MAKKHMKKCSTLPIKEMKINVRFNLQIGKSIMRYQFTLIRMDIIKRQPTRSVGKDVEKGIVLFTLCGNINWYSNDGKQYTDSSKIKNRNTK